MFNTLEALLIAHSVITAFILLIFGLILKRRHLFRWSTAGFWSWFAFFLFLLLNPLANLWVGDLTAYQLRVSVSGGLSRAEWISFISIIAIIVFFVVYLNGSGTGKKPISLLHHQPFTLPVIAVLAGFISFAFFALLKFRTGILQSTRIEVIENGRFTGEVTGYERVGHSFIFIPVVFLILSNNRFSRLIGWVIAAVFLTLRMLDAWDRFTAVSLLVALMLAHVIHRKKTFPPIIAVVFIVVVGGVLQIRGHSRLGSFDEFTRMATQIPDTFGEGLAGNETAMLPTWYVSSYATDSVTGYDWGIPVVNYLLFGFIPGRFFPDKYFLLDWWQSLSPQPNSEIAQLLYGAKSSLFGSFYDHGGIVAVLIGAALMGVFCRKLDRMVVSDNIYVRTLGITWLSVLWMTWASSTVWGMMLWGTLSIPAIGLYFATKLKPRSVTYNPSTYISPPINRPWPNRTLIDDN